jgi:hypothetical protein
MDAMMLLRMYNRAWNVVDFCFINLKHIWTTVAESYTPKTYVFFDKISAPYSRTAVNVGAPSSALPLWSYNAETSTFVEWNSGVDAKRASLPLLSLVVVDEERIIHDLTDFVESIRVVHSNAAHVPSIAHIIGAWSLSSKIVLNPTNEYFANTITTTAETIAFPITDHTYLDTVMSKTEAEGT